MRRLEREQRRQEQIERRKQQQEERERIKQEKQAERERQEANGEVTTHIKGSKTFIYKKKGAATEDKTEGETQEGAQVTRGQTTRPARGGKVHYQVKYQPKQAKPQEEEKQEEQVQHQSQEVEEEKDAHTHQHEEVQQNDVDDTQEGGNQPEEEEQAQDETYQETTHHQEEHHQEETQQQHYHHDSDQEDTNDLLRKAADARSNPLDSYSASKDQTPQKVQSQVQPTQHQVEAARVTSQLSSQLNIGAPVGLTQQTPVTPAQAAPVNQLTADMQTYMFQQMQQQMMMQQQIIQQLQQ